MTAKKSARQHARERGALDGADAQALEGALAMTERERDEARANYQWMVERAADETLDGYRDLASRLAAAENERDDALRERDAWERRARVAVSAMNARPHTRECVKQSAYNIVCVCGIPPEDDHD